jgi:hypothetical protein
MRVFNELWVNPLEDWNGVLHQMPPPLQALKLADLPYICKTMVHTNFAFSRSSNLQFAHLDGTVSIYRSRRALSRHDGLQQILVEWNVDNASVERILDASNWLTEHNPVYREANDVEQEQLPEASLEVLEEEMAEANISFPWSVVAAAEAGPRAGDVEVQNLQVGTDRGGRAQYFRDPDLMLKAFPELFPFGRGGFSLWHQKKNLRTEDQAGVPVLSLKDYVKYRLNHFDSHFAHSPRFICFVKDWITKDATYGHFMRATTTRHGQRATVGADVLQGKKKVNV